MCADNDDYCIGRVHMDRGQPEGEGLKWWLERLILVSNWRTIEVAFAQPSIKSGDDQVYTTVRQKQVMHDVILPLAAKVPGLEHHLLLSAVRSILHHPHDQVNRHLCMCWSDWSGIYAVLLYHAAALSISTTCGSWIRSACSLSPKPLRDVVREGPLKLQPMDLMLLLLYNLPPANKGGLHIEAFWYASAHNPGVALVAGLSAHKRHRRMETVS
mmetsp:Transcript_24486/g.70294  ORF Transcript_24486/g.70294 Transcript_24486/m.70294 type:complete len:214 (+) Transcript_24486:3300-3941(+)